MNLLDVPQYERRIVVKALKIKYVKFNYDDSASITSALLVFEDEKFQPIEVSIFGLGIKPVAGDYYIVERASFYFLSALEFEHNYQLVQ